MHSAKILATLLLAGSAWADYGYGSSSSSSESAAAVATASSTVSSSSSSTDSSSSSEETVHIVQVGENGTLTFSPNNVIANVGDLVQFQFWPKNHSVVQSTFAQPCIPIGNVMPNVTTAFYSGFMPTNRTSSGTGSGTLTYTIRVTAANPIWFYCGQGKHCQSGMVGAINAATTGAKTVEAFAQLAAQAQENLVPGEESGSSTSSSSSSSSSNSTSNSGSTTLATGVTNPTVAFTGVPGAQQTSNVAPGQLLDGAKGSMVGIAAAAAAFMFL